VCLSKTLRPEPHTQRKTHHPAIYTYAELYRVNQMLIRVTEWVPSLQAHQGAYGHKLEFPFSLKGLPSVS
jgi:formylglycine-generating enzyme required for sulfatase activity